VENIPSDWTLLKRIGRKDEEAFSALYDRYSGMVFSEAKRMLRDAGAAEEVLQDLFYDIWQRAGQFDTSKGSLPGWLLLSARSRALAKLSGQDGLHEELRENAAFLSIDLESHAAQNQLAQKMRELIEGLPMVDRQLLEGAYFEGLSYEKIAAKIGQPIEAVKATLSKAIPCLEQVLN
jgi:RNA polymerase sigma-70 factor, ECF subfamily